MQLILDNLIAIIVAGVVMMTLHVNQIRSSHSSLEQVAVHSVKDKTIIFGKWVEDDILNLGANFGVELYRFEAPVVDPLTGNTTEWTFYSDSTRTDGSELRVFKRYRLVETSTATFANTATFQLYQVERDSTVADFNADGTPPTLASLSAGDWVLGTRSIGTLSFFEIDLLDRRGETPCPDGTDIANPDGKVVDCTGDIDVTRADYVRVRFGVVPEYVLKPDNYIRELYWVKTLKVRPYWTPPPSLASTS